MGPLTARVASVAAVLAVCSIESLAYNILENSHLRYGSGSEDSVDPQTGELRQMWYYNEELADDDGGGGGYYYGGGDEGPWFRTTFSTYPYRTSLFANGAKLSRQVPSEISYVSSTQARVVQAFGPLTVTSTYLLVESTRYASHRVCATGVAAAGVGMWEGTNDDYIGRTDGPQERLGTFDADMSFVEGPSGNVLRVFSNDEFLYSYSDFPGTQGLINSCCTWNKIEGRTSSPMRTGTGDNSYGTHYPIGDLAAGECSEIESFLVVRASSEAGLPFIRPGDTAALPGLPSVTTPTTTTTSTKSTLTATATATSATTTTTSATSTTTTTTSTTKTTVTTSTSTKSTVTSTATTATTTTTTTSTTSATSTTTT
eukprot:CAMPEP_0198529322 /NCGR_PEP_ID=MMETSP1462-20131121/25686_1 /TAXON_ID=1333877 /ORGANISM="Brandtodinium nutriculum, Strain RCC3387" /LENGTH=370 /DNA_ID=CAMNT_0044259165 /DNA_START=185 /DNA_END=1293 /DNA_ORIENTATION=+